eukprot:TRINITY_DN9534_c0_g4_i1.p1 TRINITY_DN9534_c0_g4~~TRINITY_DN9534_c0_g4_i1.p1  ORF type:complete len:139 (-),score=41.49 TRINITY_DN9534_c0_g4_i1:229-645(-)
MSNISSGSFLFMIVGKGDFPIYEAEFGTPRKESAANLGQFIIHAALDIVDDVVWTTNSLFLKNVDKYMDMTVSAFITVGHIRFMLLHENQNEASVKNFFQEVYEYYMKVICNPFYSLNTTITSPTFDARVKQLAKKYF